MSKLTEFDISDTATARAEFRVGTTLTDPTTVTLTITHPSGSVDTYTYGAAQITKDATGMFSKGVVVDASGEWISSWTGTGAAAAVGVLHFAVRRSGA